MAGSRLLAKQYSYNCNSTGKENLVMQTKLRGLVVLGIVMVVAVAFSTGIINRRAADLRAAEPTGTSKMLAHNVYFTLHDPSAANIQQLIGACHKYLSKHPGTALYCAGTVSDLDREVNDRDWHVGLHLIFNDRAAHDAYQVHPEHLKFIEENKALWKKVRVFDSDAAKS